MRLKIPNEKEVINPTSLFDSTEYGFPQIVVSNAGKMIFFSGQVACDEHLNIIGANDLEKQARKSMDNLENAMQAAAGRMEDIVILRIYIVNYQKEDGAIINQVLKDTFGTRNPPASTWISVQGLANEGFMIEIEAQAVI